MGTSYPHQRERVKVNFIKRELYQVDYIYVNQNDNKNPYCSDVSLFKNTLETRLAYLSLVWKDGEDYRRDYDSEIDNDYERDDVNYSFHL